MSGFSKILILFGTFYIIVAGCTDINKAGRDFHIKETSRLNNSGKPDTAWVNYYVRQGFKSLASKKGNALEDAMAYLDTASLVCERYEFDFPPLFHLLRAELLYAKSDFSTSETEASLAERKAAIEGNYNLQARALLFLGRYYQRTGFFQESIEYYNKSIALAEEMNLRGVRQKSYDGQAQVFHGVGDLKAYARNLEKMIEVSLLENDTLTAVSGLLRLGSYLVDDGRDFSPADSVLRKCINLSLSFGNTYYASFAMANLGWNFYSEKMLDSALFYYKKSLSLSLPDNHLGVSTNAYGNLGTIYRDKGDTYRALQFYEKSLQQAEMIDDWYSLSWVYKDMTDLYLSRSDTSRAFKTFVLHKQFSDSVLTRENIRGLAEARIRYDADAHNKEIALLSLRLKNNRILIAAFSVLVVGLFVIGFLILRSSRINAMRRISEMNHKISEITQANLRQQMNPHFIFNTLNSIQYYMYQHDKLATNTYLTKFSSLMRKVLDNSQHTSVPLQDELDALKLYLDLECLRFKDKFEYRITVDEEIDPLMYKIPTMLIQPYVENSICHGLIPLEGKGYVSIDLKLKPDHILCIIEDNGIGREAATERKKKTETNHNSLGTRITSSRLDIVNAMYGTSLETIFTDLKNNEGEAVGTRVELHIPILT
ncbi:MAG TPA: histidine kinase [Bacteroidales bacterium]|nr:histidine kinase [Bacteroidales bacterium]HPJ58502.1 histidine kinase [Bacteroidales bacterium]HPR11677.1 histidine kinase [Bacteroidales bacterium]HRW85512.1 histidine kinase [Bacteroidales bacterium]